MEDENHTYLMIIGNQKALSWVLSTRQIAFPAGRASLVSNVKVGDELLIYTTRNCFGNPARDLGRVVASTTVSSEVATSKNPIEFNEKVYPLQCSLELSGLTRFGEGPILRDLVAYLDVFPDPVSWSAHLRRPLLRLNEKDSEIIKNELNSNLLSVEDAMKSYPFRSHEG